MGRVRTSGLEGRPILRRNSRRLGSKYEYIVQLEPVLQCEAAGEARKDRAEAESWWRLKMIPSKTKTQKWKFRARETKSEETGKLHWIGKSKSHGWPHPGAGKKGLTTGQKKFSRAKDWKRVPSRLPSGRPSSSIRELLRLAFPCSVRLGFARRWTVVSDGVLAGRHSDEQLGCMPAGARAHKAARPRCGQSCQNGPGHGGFGDVASRGGGMVRSCSGGEG